MAKPKVAFYWCASCGGCEEAIVDLNEDILKVADLVNIVFWPCAMDFKYEDVRNMKDDEITVAFINGAIRTEENEEMAKLLRQKSQIVIAFGACSHMGGIPGLGNFWDKETIFESSYGKSCPSVENPDGIVPQERWQVAEGELTLPKFFNTPYAFPVYFPGITIWICFVSKLIGSITLSFLSISAICCSAGLYSSI